MEDTKLVTKITEWNHGAVTTKGWPDGEKKW